MAVLLKLLLAAALVAGVGYGGYQLLPEDDGRQYTVELDNAFGLVEGADVKIAGVRAGVIDRLRVGPDSKRALVDFTVNEQGFGELRTDAFCETRPQSLIGEYFIDCLPGQAPARLPEGSTIPVAQTASTIPLDLVNNILRRPYRERFRIILAELGAGVGGRAEDLNAALRRAVPALRETDRVLRRLARQNRTLQQLTRDADIVVGELAENREAVVDFVQEARDTAAISASRSAELRAGFQRLPTFLRELRPTMVELGDAADAQVPALRDLNAASGQLRALLENLQPFVRTGRPAIESLGDASVVGEDAAKAARPTVAQLREAVKTLPELANNLEFVLKDLDDRGRAVEKNPVSPGGQGFTGLEAFLQYAFDQSQAINIYDENTYILKVDAFFSKCSDYQNPTSLKAAMERDPDLYKDCAAQLGPNQPGVTSPDPTETTGGDEGEGTPPRTGARRDARKPARERAAAPERAPAAERPAATNRERDPRRASSPAAGVRDTLGALLGEPPKAPPLPSLTPRESLMDYLFAP